MASERAKQMQQANTLAEVLASLERIEIALGIKPKPEEPKAAAKAEKTPPIQGSGDAAPAQSPVFGGPRQGMASRQNPVGGKR